jgi:DNA-binding NarL/FixJ family response regulator
MNLPAPPIKVKVLLVDDHAIVRTGLRNMLSQQSHLIVAGEASSGQEALHLVAETAPEIVLMDIHLPDMNGLELSRQMLSKAPAPKIIIYSGDSSRSTVDEALRVGVYGFISKTGAPDEVLQAIASVLKGKLFLSSDVGADALDVYRKGLSKSPESMKPLISERERQLLRLVAEGKRNKEIANSLSISCKAVELARSRLMQKLGTSSSAELVRYAVREGIAEP